MFEIYAYWNATSIKAALDGVAMIMGGNDFLGLMKTIALLGLLTSAAMGMLKMSFKEPGQYLVILAIVYGVLFVPKVTVTVRDLRSGGVMNVANVPLGVAFISSSTSLIGKYLTEAFETSFAAADELSFSKTGMAWGANSMKTLADMRPKNPKAVEAWANFTKACVVPEIVENADKFKVLVDSTKVLELLATDRGTATGFLNPARIAKMPKRLGTGYDNFECINSIGSGSAYDEAVAWLVAEEAAQTGWLAKNLLPDNNINANALIGTYLPGVEGILLGSSRTITDQIMQSLTVNLLNVSAGNMGLVAGDSSAVALQIGTITAQKSAENSYRVMGMIGAEILPKMRNIVEIILIAVFPIVMVIIILAGEKSFGVIKTYAMTSVWVQLWAPLYAVINHMLTPLTASRLQAATGGFVTQTMENSQAIIQTGFSEQAMAGALVMAVPMIAYALVRGGEVAMGSAAGALSAPAQGAATSKGGEAGVGNVSVGSTSWGNHSSNNVSSGKWDTNGSVSSGAFFTSSGLTKQSYDMGTGGGAIDASAGASNLGEYNAEAKGALSSAATQAYTQSWGEAQSHMSTFSDSAQSAYTNYTRAGRNSGTQTGVKDSSGFGTETGDGVAAQRAVAANQQLAARTGLKSEEAFAATMAASLGVGSPDGGKAAFKAGFGGKLEAAGKVSADQAWDMVQAASQSADFKQLQQSVDKASRGTTTEKGATAGTTRESGNDASLTSAKQSLEQASLAATRAQNYQQAAQTANTMGGSATEQLNNKVVDRLGGQGRAQELLTQARTGNTEQRAAARGEIQNAINSVVKDELEGAMGGAYGAGAKGGAPALTGNPGTKAARLQGDVDNKADRAEADVVDGKRAVRDDHSKKAAQVGNPTSPEAISVNGQTPEQVQALSEQRMVGATFKLGATRQAVEAAAQKLTADKPNDTGDLTPALTSAGNAAGGEVQRSGKALLNSSVVNSTPVGAAVKLYNMVSGRADTGGGGDTNPKTSFSTSQGWKDMPIQLDKDK